MAAGCVLCGLDMWRLLVQSLNGLLVLAWMVAHGSLCAHLCASCECIKVPKVLFFSWEHGMHAIFFFFSRETWQAIGLLVAW